MSKCCWLISIRKRSWTERRDLCGYACFNCKRNSLARLLGEQLTKQAQDRLTLSRMEMTASHPTLKQRQGLLRIIFSLGVIGLFRRAKSLLKHKGDVVYVALNEVLSAMPVG